MNTNTPHSALPGPGQIKRVIFPACQNLPVWIYRPKHDLYKPQAIVAVHGISRNSQQQVQAYAGLAEEHGLWLLAPEFDKAQFPGYQRLAKTAQAARADLALNTLLIAFRGLRQQPELKIHLCGYSGGAQFAHRYAYLHPYNLASLTLVSAGWYTLTDEQTDYPLGTGDWPKWQGPLRLNDFLKIPAFVMVGSQDIRREKSLRQDTRVDHQQGLNRLQRAHTWVETTNRAKQTQGLTPDIRLCLMPNQRHDFQKNVQDSDMLFQISHFWYQIEGNYDENLSPITGWRARADAVRLSG
ncbi:MAG: hypothetical protein ACPGF7_04895 [Pontibacterium sp.]